MTLREGLDRTLMLMRDYLSPSASDNDLLRALTGTEVALISDERAVSCHAGQCAFVTVALLLARSGHTVYLMAPDVALLHSQPPMRGDRLIASLLETGLDLLPSVSFMRLNHDEDQSRTHHRTRVRSARGLNETVSHKQNTSAPTDRPCGPPSRFRPLWSEYRTQGQRSQWVRKVPFPDIATNLRSHPLVIVSSRAREVTSDFDKQEARVIRRTSRLKAGYCPKKKGPQKRGQFGLDNDAWIRSYRRQLL